jgi:hypothetical protein
MMETEKGKRMDQILATGVTREELAEALWCAESSVRMWNECADALRNENAELRKLLVGAYKDMDEWQKVIASSDQWGYGKGCLDSLCELRDAMRELRVEVDE